VRPSKSPWEREITGDDRIVREKERKERTGISRVHWWRLESLGEAPRRVSLGTHAVGWVSGELTRWIKERAAARDS